LRLVYLIVFLGLFLSNFSFTSFSDVNISVFKEQRHDRISAAVFFNNHIVVRFYGTDAENGDPFERANLLKARLTQLAALGVDPEDRLFFAGIEGYSTVIKYDDFLICKVLAAETTVNMTNDVFLANEWLKNIKFFLASIPRDSHYVEKEIIFPIKGFATLFEPLIVTKKFNVAHDTLPIGTRLRIVNLSNNWSVVAEVTERKVPNGNFVIALAPNTAYALGITEENPLLVRIFRER